MESGKRKRTPSQDSNRKDKSKQKKEKKADTKKRKRSSSSDGRKPKSKKGGGKGGKKGDRTLWQTKKDGKNICFKYNGKGCDRADCKLLHVCQVCLKEGHGGRDCRKA